ncbi:hypothetical protein N7478_012174 [Penicillium angulare]|uniref:uncharacterized protein n=1 Tax=Penicillium angulare TaxID=116970 RepID=UPI0025413428|nr:uncharacterized protein N7478_012174 [Penicillium angulare]KAJ5260569.1 hypothetical protein N7478_012174 [Penicillium angulare]
MTLNAALAIYTALFYLSSFAVGDFCSNTPTSRSCWGGYNISTDYYSVTPYTGVTREFWLSVQNQTLAPDGYERTVLTANGTLPGPLIEADWGDDFIIHVTNKFTNNGYPILYPSFLLHPMRWLIQQPGLQLTGMVSTNKGQIHMMYGTSWYHSHWDLQLADGLYGPIVIHGPATSDYDIELGPVFITDWFHETDFQSGKRKQDTEDSQYAKMQTHRMAL